MFRGFCECGYRTRWRRLFARHDAQGCATFPAQSDDGDEGVILCAHPTRSCPGLDCSCGCYKCRPDLYGPIT